MLAELQAQSELAGTVSASSAMTGLNAEEQALYEELERETATESPAPAAPRAESTQASSSVAPPTKAPAPSEPRRAEPEAG
jgi:hypothetical protein